MFLFQFFSLNDLLDFMHAHMLFVLRYPLSKSQKAENNLFSTLFYSTLLQCFVFVICRHFMTLKWLKVSKLSNIGLKMVKAMTPKQPIRTFCFSGKVRMRHNLHCRFNEWPSGYLLWMHISLRANCTLVKSNINYNINLKSFVHVGENTLSGSI